MNIFINPQSDKGAPVLQAKPSGSPISQLRFKRGSSVPLTVTLLGVTEAGNLRIGMKRRDRYESPLLVYATAAEPDEAEGSSNETAPCGVRFTLMLHVNSEELNEALGVGDSVDVPGAVAALTEVCWEEGEVGARTAMRIFRVESWRSPRLNVFRAGGGQCRALRNGGAALDPLDSGVKAPAVRLEINRSIHHRTSPAEGSPSTTLQDITVTPGQRRLHEKAAATSLRRPRRFGVGPPCRVPGAWGRPNRRRRTPAQP